MSQQNLSIKPVGSKASGQLLQDKKNANSPIGLETITPCVSQGVTTPNRWLLVSVWLMSVFACLIIGLFYSASSSRFYGLADGETQVVNFQYAVEVEQLKVSLGQSIKQGDFLGNFRRFDLVSETALVKEKISQIESEINRDGETFRSEISRLNALKGSSLAELNTQLLKTRSQLKLNKQWSKQNSNGGLAENRTSNVLQAKYDGLLTQIAQQKRLYNSQIVNYQQQLDPLKNPNSAKLEANKKRLVELQRQAGSLAVSAPFSGRVAAIYFTAGEQVEKFKPVLQIISDRPTFIRAYIHESLLHHISVNQAVWVSPLSGNNQNKQIVAKVKSLANQIVEYPARLKRNQFSSVWGREVILQLDHQSELLIGEKVAIQLNEPADMSNFLRQQRERVGNFLQSIFQTNYATASESTLKLELISESEAPIKISEKQELSGLVFEPISGKFIAIDDESNALYFLSPQGKVVATSKIEELKMDDIESISLDHENIYVLASNSWNKKGKHPLKRRKLAQLEISEQAPHWKLKQQVDLYALLKNWSKDNKTPSSVKDFLQKAIKEKSLDIESHQVRDNHLYIGFKAPFVSFSGSSVESEKQKFFAVILKVWPLDKIMAGSTGQVDWYKKLEFPQFNANQTMLSDLYFGQEAIYLTTVNESRALDRSFSSQLWQLAYQESTPRLLKTFIDLKAEGIYQQQEEGIFLLFEQGKFGSWFVNFKKNSLDSKVYKELKL